MTFSFDSLWQALKAALVVGTLVDCLVILLLTLLVLRLLALLVRRAHRYVDQSDIDAARRARLTTVLHVSWQTARALIVLVAVLMALTQLGFDISPVLTGLGLAGLALSLGAQQLIKDCIGGITILVENQFGIGDVVQIGSVTGTVERLTLRATYLRDVEGKVILVPNGDVRIVSNVTRDWARAVVDLNVAFESDMGVVVEVLQRAMEAAAQDDEIKSDLIEDPTVQGWSRLTDWAVQVRLMAKTRPGCQWRAAIVLRRYALDALNTAGIRLATPQAAGSQGTA
jgi:moderate conductance mechanosensitive channel